MKLGHSSSGSLGSPQTQAVFGQRVSTASPCSTSEGSVSSNATLGYQSKCWTPEQPSDIIEEVLMLDLPVVISNDFAPIGAALHLLDIAAIASTSQMFAGRVREELARRDQAVRRLRVWSNHPHWDLCLARVCALESGPGRWNTLPPTIHGRVGAVCTMNGNFIYVIGGTCRGKPTNAAERLSLECGTWEDLPPLPGQRCVDRNTAVAGIGAKMYLFGGQTLDQLSPSSCVDCFDPEHCQWTDMPDMPSPRFGATAAVMSGRVFICGGSGAVGTSFLPVLCFNPQAHLWESLPPMLNKHHRGEAVIANSTIYFGTRDCRPVPFSGFDEAESGTPFSLTQGERFHTNTRTWSRCMSAMFSSSGSSIALAMSNSLYLCEAPYNGRSVSERCVRVTGTERSGNEGSNSSASTEPSAQLGVWPYQSNA